MVWESVLLAQLGHRPQERSGGSHSVSGSCLNSGVSVSLDAERIATGRGGGDENLEECHQGK